MGSAFAGLVLRWASLSQVLRASTSERLAVAARATPLSRGQRLSTTPGDVASRPGWALWARWEMEKAHGPFSEDLTCQGLMTWVFLCFFDVALHMHAQQTNSQIRAFFQRPRTGFLFDDKSGSALPASRIRGFG